MFCINFDLEKSLPQESRSFYCLYKKLFFGVFSFGLILSIYYGNLPICLYDRPHLPISIKSLCFPMEFSKSCCSIFCIMYKFFSLDYVMMLWPKKADEMYLKNRSINRDFEDVLCCLIVVLLSYGKENLFLIETLFMHFVVKSPYVVHAYFCEPQSLSGLNLVPLTTSILTHTLLFSTNHSNSP